MAVARKPLPVILTGALAVAGLAVAGASVTGPRLSATLTARAAKALTEARAAPLQARFALANGWPTRHPTLIGGERLDEATRARAALAVAAIPGVGGVRWSDGGARVVASDRPLKPLDCEADVAALLRSRSIRFEESSARIDAASGELVNEVAAALRPCLGNIIAITGHTDASGPEPGNIALSLERAEAVRSALVARDIPADGLRIKGVGSRQPVAGLEPSDPANRRIEFSVVASAPVRPTPIDTPGPR